jgi:hypothetical protein
VLSTEDLLPPFHPRALQMISLQTAYSAGGLAA